MPLLEWLQREREARTEAAIWGDIVELRRLNPGQYDDLPPNYSELQRQIRALVIAGRVKRDGELVSYVPVVPKQERTLF